MKTISSISVFYMMELLIHTNGSTTTLDVKKGLRNLGYFAEQNEVKKLIEDFFENSNLYTRSNDTTNYFVYTWSLARMTDESFPGFAEELVEEDDIVSVNVSDDSVTTDSVSAGTILQDMITSVKQTRDPEYIYYIETHAKQHTGDADSWVVFNVNGNSEIHIYNEDLTRDNVRSRYAKLNNCKIQDVRSKRLINYKK